MYKKILPITLLISSSLYLSACVKSINIPEINAPTEQTLSTDDFWKFTNLESINELLEKGQDVNNVNINGQTPLMLSLIYNQSYTFDAASLLIKSGANVNVQNAAGMTPLMLTIVQNPANVLDIVEFLIKAGADVNAKDNNGQTPLMLSIAFSNSVKMLDLLIRNGAKVDATDNLGMTALMLAAQTSNNVNLAKALLLCGADINATDNSKMTALAHLLRDNYTTHAHEFLTFFTELEDIDFTIRDIDGVLPFNHALFNNALYNSRPYWTLKDILMRQGITDLFFIQKNR